VQWHNGSTLVMKHDLLAIKQAALQLALAVLSHLM
jgi:hypothetical protein